MAKQRMKMDIYNLIRHIDEVISNSRSKIARENGYSISIGLDLLISYLKEIGQLAIDQDNKELIEILLDFHVLRYEDDQGIPATPTTDGKQLTLPEISSPER